MSSKNQSSVRIPLRVIKKVIGIFSLVGIGLGLAGGITVLQLGGGGGILGGILTLVILVFAFLSGPILAVITGLDVGERNGRSSQAYIAEAVGAVGGFFSMMIIILLILALAMSTLSDGSGATAAQSASESSTGLEIGEYIVPIVAIAIPTAIAGLGGVFLGGDNQDQGGEVKTDATENSIPIKKVGVAIAVIAIIGAGVVFVPGIISTPSGENLIVRGEITVSGEEIVAAGTVENPKDQEISTTVTYNFVVDEETIGTSEEEITVPAGERIEISSGVLRIQELTEQERTAIQNGNFRMEFIIEGEISDTATA